MKTIIEMAREAGFAEKDAMYRVAFVANKNNLERFAALIRADLYKEMNDPLVLMCKQMVADEREACAKVCDELHPGLATRVAAEAIRARGNT